VSPRADLDTVVKRRIPNPSVLEPPIIQPIPEASPSSVYFLSPPPGTNIHLTTLFSNTLSVLPLWLLLLLLLLLLSSFLVSTAQLRPWPPPQNPVEFLGNFSTILFFTG
jgi:hypothetical protein